MNKLTFGMFEIDENYKGARSAFCGTAICYDEFGQRFRSRDGIRRAEPEGSPCFREVKGDNHQCPACRELEKEHEARDYARKSRLKPGYLKSGRDGA